MKFNLFKLIKEKLISVVAVIGAIVSLYTYYEGYDSNKQQKKETNRCLVKIAREETDINVDYFNSTHLEVRHSNQNQGLYLFHKGIIVEVYYDKSVKDYYVQKGNVRDYLKDGVIQ